MLTKEGPMRIASGLAVNLAFIVSFARAGWAQAPDSIGPSGPRPLATGSVVATVLTLGLLAVVVVALIAVARFVAVRRKRMTEALIFQSQLSDAVAREAVLQSLQINPRARVSGWRKSHVTVEVAGEVPTPELREKAMRIVRAEAWRLQPDINTVDHLFIVPPREPASDATVPRR
jgi:hypothetical protein